MSVPWDWSGCIIFTLIFAAVIGFFFLWRWIDSPPVHREPSDMNTQRIDDLVKWNEELEQSKKELWNTIRDLQQKEKSE